eukprot:COSAG02_NODE_1402_length_12818_cov_18.233352_8_plen_69_part_00
MSAKLNRPNAAPFSPICRTVENNYTGLSPYHFCTVRRHETPSLSVSANATYDVVIARFASTARVCKSL